MKNEIILWLSSLVIIFLLGYVKNVTDKDYPITGTFGIEGKRVSYKMDKVSFDKSSYKNIIISDIKGINARLVIVNDDEREEIPYKEINRGLEAEIPKLKPGQQLRYKTIINYKDDIFEIPKNDFVTLTFWGYIPSPVKILYFIILYGGMIVSIRSLLELFNENKNLKKYAFITSTLFITLNIIIYPLYDSYKLGAINNFVPPITDLVNPMLLTILFLWVIGTIFIFNKIYIKAITIIISAATIISFFFI
jgi:hypothetical protein